MATDNARLLNLKKSLDVYFNANYSETSVEFMGTVLDKSSLTEWVRFAYAGPDAAPGGWADGKKVIYQNMILDVACFVKFPPSNAGRLWDIAAEVIAAVERKDIELKDYAAVGNPVEGYLRCEEGSADYVGVTADLGFQVEQMTVSVPLSWHEKKG